MRGLPILLLLFLVNIVPSTAFVCVTSNRTGGRRTSNGKTALYFFGRSTKVAKIPSSPSDRDKQAIDSVKAAIDNPKDPSFPLIECEFPPLKSLNKLGDGSLRSATEVEQANLAFAIKLLQSISPLPLVGPKTWLLISSTASSSFLSRAESQLRGAASLHSLRDGMPEVGQGDVCVLVAPSSRSDYDAAQRIASAGKVGAVVILNGFAKDAKSVSGRATMSYFLKPLTYNSQVAGYLIRSFPSKWTVIDAISKEVLGTFDDSILVSGTNTPDLRESGRLVQKSVDERAIRARQG